MMKRFMDTLVGVAMLAGVASVTYSAPAFAACGTFLTFPPWYNGLTTSSCELKEIVSTTKSGEYINTSTKVSLNAFIFNVILNIIQIVLQLVAYAAVVFLMIGGFRYLTSAGDPNLMSTAKKTITNSIIGLVLSIASAGIVNVVSGAF